MSILIVNLTYRYLGPTFHNLFISYPGITTTTSSDHSQIQVNLCSLEIESLFTHTYNVCKIHRGTRQGGAGLGLGGCMPHEDI